MTERRPLLAFSILIGLGAAPSPASAAPVRIGIHGGIHVLSIDATYLAQDGASFFLSSARSYQLFGVGPSAGASVSFFQDSVIGLRIAGQVSRLSATGDGQHYRSTAYVIAPLFTVQFEASKNRHSIGLGPIFIQQASVAASASAITPSGESFLQVAGALIEGKDWLNGRNEAQGVFLLSKAYILPRFTQSNDWRYMASLEIGYDF